jgi:hypothetical protein
MTPSLPRMRRVLRKPLSLKKNIKLILTLPKEITAVKNSSQLLKKLRVKELRWKKRKRKRLRNLRMITLKNN